MNQLNWIIFFTLLIFLANYLSQTKCSSYQDLKKCKIRFGDCFSRLNKLSSNYELICRRLGQNFTRFHQIIRWCNRSFKDFRIKYFLNRYDTLENHNQIDFSGLFKFTKLIQSNYITFYFRYINGFHVNFYKNFSIPKYQKKTSASIKIYESKFYFFLNGKRLDSCALLKQANYSERWVFQTFEIHGLHIISPRFKYDICPWLFSHLNAYKLYVGNLVNTFYKKNVLRFSNDYQEESSRTKLITSFSNIILEHLVDIDINSTILHPLVFGHVRVIELYGEVRSIQVGLFKSFKTLRTIRFRISCARRLFHRGIEWINELNARTHVELNNQKALRDYFKQFFRHFEINLGRMQYSMNVKLFYWEKESSVSYVFPDEDFCLYRNFPFDRLIVFTFDEKYDFNGIHKYTCTYVWLYQYYLPYLGEAYRFIQDESWIAEIFSKNLSQDIIECQFQKR